MEQMGVAVKPPPLPPVSVIEQTSKLSAPRIAMNHPSKKVLQKRGRDKRPGSRRHRKVGSSRDGI